MPTMCSNAPDLITCSNKPISPCWHWDVYKDVQEPESSAVVSNHIHSCSVHFRRTIIFITSLSSSLRHRTWQHLGLVHCLYVSVFKKKIVFFQYKYLGLATSLHNLPDFLASHLYLAMVALSTPAR